MYRCMMAYCEKIVLSAVEKVCQDRVDGIIVAFPTEKGRGHLYTNVAMKLARPMKMNPMEVGESISKLLEKDPAIASVELVSPGFINLTLKSHYLHGQLIELLKQKTKFGHQNVGNGEKVNLEYVSANPTGPLHVANARGAVLGDVLANVFSALGYDVCREYYINDAGGQVDILSKSLFEAYKKALGVDYEIGEGMYNYQYLFELGEEIAKRDGDKWLNQPQEVRAKEIGGFGVMRVLERIKDDLSSFGVHHDVFSSEKEICSSGAIEEAIQLLKEKGFMYYGCLPPPRGKGAKLGGYISRKQLLFRSSEFGDNQDRSVQKENGEWTYFATDIAYHLNKIKRGFHKQIALLGADHGSYLKRMEGAVTALSDGKASLKCFVYQLVNLIKNGDKVSMSKRSGNFVPLKELLSKVESGVVRFIMLTRHHNMHLDFDCEKAIQETRENPYYYFQYAYVRASSVLEKGQKLGSIEPEDLKHLEDECYISLMVKLLGWPSCVRQTADSLDPHKIATYLLELSALFHEIWSMGNLDSSLRFIQDKPDLGKLALVQAVAYTLESGMGILGIEPLKRL